MMRDVIFVAAGALVLVLVLLGWRRGRRLRVLIDAVRDLDFTALTAYHHGRLEEVPLAERAMTQRQGGVVVTVAVLSARESRALFGTNLARSGIQPDALCNSAVQPSDTGLEPLAFGSRGRR